MAEKKKSFKKRALRVLNLILTFGMYDWMTDGDGALRRNQIESAESELKHQVGFTDVVMVASYSPCKHNIDCYLNGILRDSWKFVKKNVNLSKTTYIVNGVSLTPQDLTNGTLMQLKKKSKPKAEDFVLIKVDEALYREMQEYEEEQTVYDYIVRFLIGEIEVTTDAETLRKNLCNNTEEACLLYLKKHMKQLLSHLECYKAVYPTEKTAIVSCYYVDGDFVATLCRPEDIIGTLRRI